MNTTPTGADNVLNLAGSAFSLIPGIGTAINAGIGLFQNLFGSNKRKRELEEKARKAELEAKRQQEALKAGNFRQVLESFPTQGVTTPSLYKYGGKIPSVKPDFIAEDDEIIQHNPGEFPVASNNGQSNPLSLGMTKLSGDKHSDPSGGIGVQAKGSGFVFSNQIPVPDEILQRFKKIKL